MAANPQLYGPTAQITFRTYLTPEGGISHYEIQGHTPDGKLSYYRAQGAAAPFEHDSALAEMLGHHLAVIRRALEDLQTTYGHQLTLDETPEAAEAVLRAARRAGGVLNADDDAE